MIDKSKTNSMRYAKKPMLAQHWLKFSKYRFFS